MIRLLNFTILVIPRVNIGLSDVFLLELRFIDFEQKLYSYSHVNHFVLQITKQNNTSLKLVKHMLLTDEPLVLQAFKKHIIAPLP